MQTQEILKLLRLPEMGDLSQFLRSLSATTLVSMGALAAILAYWFTHRPKALTPPCNLLLQSEEVEDSGGARRSVIGGGLQLLTHFYDDARTMYQVFRRGLTISGNGPCLGFRKPKQPYQWLSYQEVADRAEFLGSGLLQHSCKASTDQFIGVFAQNRPEWIIAELACYTYSMVVVPLYDTLGPGAIRYIINTADISTVIVDKPQKAMLLLEHVERRETPGLKLVILMEPFEEALKERGRKCGVVMKSMQDVEDCGQENHHAPVPPQPDDLSIVCFTSGTTGNPKGAMLTHGNVVADFSGFLKVTEDHFLFVVLRLSCCLPVSVSSLSVSHARHLQKVIFPRQDDVLISFLPLAHMFERVIQSVVYCHGGRVGFFQGDIRLLSDDMKALRPTIFPVVPRLLNRMYDKIFSQADTPLKRWLLEFAAKRKQAEVHSGIIRNNSIWDELFFNKIQASLGGHVRMIVTGAAPASPTVLGFLRAALGCQVYEGYGQTECTAGCTFTTPGDWTSGHVGAPLPCNHIKLVDVEELNYWTRKGEGEICVRGPNVFKGYLNDQERTKEALDSDGWLHTGDIGKWLPEGTLKIIDRKKHIFKLAQGEYVAPEKIENIYIRSEPVAQIYVHGDSLKAYLVGIVVPDPEVMPSWAQKRGIEGTYADMCGNKDLKKAILEDLVRLGKESGLHSFEQVKAIYIHCDMFSVQNGLLTPTLKAKRPELREYFRTQIEELYSISM
ncbi:long-chain-fatty-acid--CoA ligase 6 isoform X2 [Heterocephalus glaber]|nr:long-chain-fatty-acid--CoA ligase 6 isoform X2 [Heterocephalus glaber]XP_004836690.1 long-chain-fatty-acid--CoA ligase 6 isoform X2 [Heterocephalus glaber]XP_021097298.1 long-chain-fatty-acid--CoA ligase 6 isoform X2 [Heterocephalus glaber]XP_021097313.1 long-chain-fatty-acid--CoA ligase 6 isoform X2 [Heterocephalus glaber]